MRQALRRAVSLAAAGALAAAGLVLSTGVAHAEPIAYAIAIDDSAPVICAPGVNGQFGTIDLASGAFTAIGAPSEDMCLVDLTVGPDGTVYGLRLDLEAGLGANPWFLQTIDPATGAITASENVGATGNNDGGEGGGVAFDSSGALFAETAAGADPTLPGDCADGIAYCLAAVDPADPEAASVIGSASPFAVLESLTITCDDDFYISEAELDPAATSWDDDAELGPSVLFDASLSRVDPATGATSLIGPFGQIITGHDVDAAGRLWGVGFVVGGPPSVFTIDSATGAATATVAISNAPEGLSAIAIDHPCSVPPTPEPVVIQPTFTG
jgi:hypothetical protein